MTPQHQILRFGAFSLSVIRLLKPLMSAIRSHDRSLEKQLRSAASSISLNIAESRGRTGRDRVHFLRIALGSAEETTACLHVADAWAICHRTRRRLAWTSWHICAPYSAS